MIKLWPVFALLAIALFAYVKGQANGQANAKLACLQEKQAALTLAFEQVEETRQLNQDIADTFHETQAQAKAEIQVIEKEVIRYVNQHHHDDGCNLDANGVQLINRLIRAANDESSQH